MQRKMESACILILLSILCLSASVRCHDGKRFDNFMDLTRAHRRKGSSNHVVSQVASTAVGDYSPVYVGNQDGLKEGDMITAMPGQPKVSFSQYSGYVTVDPNAGRALFYYFTESQDTSNKPLVLWLNGGPGCSSLGAGAMMELGPFRVNPDWKTLWYNKNAWNTIANVIFLESPAGVGFSYSNTTSDYKTGDKQTAADAYTFLLNWLERFPEYKTKDFYITGESYAGHYVPQLASLILKNNGINNQTVINLKGIAIGNAFIDVVDNSKGVFEYYWTHALISDELYRGIILNCNFTLGAPESRACDDYVNRAFEAIGLIDGYNIYAPLCNYASNSSTGSGFDPCSNDYIYAYLNSPDVQKALHANVTGIPRPWRNCSLFVDYNYEDVISSIIPTIKELMASDISIWIYSGDTDSVVPVTSTKYSLAKIGAPVKTPWYPWYTQEEVGGYAVEYQNITFVTVRGSGHFVPSYQPERALAMFKSFLEGKLPPTTS